MEKPRDSWQHGFGILPRIPSIVHEQSSLDLECNQLHRFPGVGSLLCAWRGSSIASIAKKDDIARASRLRMGIQAAAPSAHHWRGYRQERSIARYASQERCRCNHPSTHQSAEACCVVRRNSHIRDLDEYHADAQSLDFVPRHRHSRAAGALSFCICDSLRVQITTSSYIPLVARSPLAARALLPLIETCVR